MMLFNVGIRLISCGYRNPTYLQPVAISYSSVFQLAIFTITTLIVIFYILILKRWNQDAGKRCPSFGPKCTHILKTEVYVAVGTAYRCTGAQRLVTFT